MILNYPKYDINEVVLYISKITLLHIKAIYIYPNMLYLNWKNLI